MTRCHCSMRRKHLRALFVTFVTAAVGDFPWNAGEEAIGNEITDGLPRRRAYAP